MSDEKGWRPLLKLCTPYHVSIDSYQLLYNSLIVTIKRIGGLNDAMELADAGLVDPEKFKFFFNYIQFSDKELKNILRETDSDGDAWASLEVPSRIVLNNDFDRGDAWSYLRNQLKQMKAI